MGAADLVACLVGTSENGLQTQIWIVLIAVLEVNYFQLRSTFGWSLYNLLALLRRRPLLAQQDLANPTFWVVHHPAFIVE